MAACLLGGPNTPLLARKASRSTLPGLFVSKGRVGRWLLCCNVANGRCSLRRNALAIRYDLVALAADHETERRVDVERG